MISLIGYNFTSDINALDPMSSNVNDVSVRIQNGIFDNVTITKDVLSEISSEKPTRWTSDTVLNATFDEDISGGNIGQIAKDITSVKVKRRQIGTFDWITIKEIEVNDIDDLSFIVNDNLAISETDYEYAFVPIIQDIEGSYVINTIKAKFNGVFICDDETIFRMYAGVSYGDTQSVQPKGVYAPYGKKYPVIVSNGVTNYQTGSFSSIILPDSYDSTKLIDKKAMADGRRLFVDFLNNKKPKLLKDWANNQWIIYITGNPTTSYMQGSGMSVASVSADWTEVGNPNVAQDLYENGLIPTIN